MFASLRENLLYKLLALAFALALHFYVAGQSNPASSRTLLVPLAAQNVPAGLLWDERAAPHVAVTVSGPADDLSRLTAGEVTAFVDLKGAHAGKNPGLLVQTSLAPESGAVSIAPGDVQPATLTLPLDAKSRRRLRITVTPPGTAPLGYAFRSPQITPEAATVEGSREAVGAVAQLAVKADADASAGAVDDDLPVVALDASGGQVEGVMVSPASAHVHIALARVPAAKTLLVSPMLTGTPPYPYKVTDVQVSPASVTVTGRPDVLARAATVPTAALDLSGATADVTRQVPCALPSGVSAVGPNIVTVTVRIAPAPAPSSPAPAAPASALPSGPPVQ